MKYLFTNASLLDGRLDENQKMPVQEHTSITVDGEKITGIYRDGQAPEEGYTKVDLKGKYLMPGLINMHVHTIGRGEAPKPVTGKVDYKAIFSALTATEEKKQQTLQMILGILKMHLYSGVTTLRTVGGRKDLDGVARDMIAEGKAEGPRVLSGNTAISVPGGHMAGSVATESASVEDALKDLDAIVASKVDWIKLMITGGVMDASAEGEPGVLRMPPEMVKAVCDKAHSLGYRVCAHVESPEGVRVALENGVDTIEHGAKLDQHMIDLFKEHKAAHICTISPAAPYALMPDSMTHSGEIGMKNGGIVMHGIIDCARTCLDNGIPVGLGTDAACNFITPYDMWRELDYFVKYDKVSHDFALHTATQVNAQILHMDDTIGTVETGKCADFLVTDYNPLDDFAAMRQPAMVVTKGRIIDKPEIDRLPDVDKALDDLRASI